MYQSRERAAVLMRLAGQEADQITTPRERLTRLLNLAELQIGQGDSAGARATLSRAGATVRACSADDLDVHLHVSAWVSISELSRRAGDPGAARSACQEGLTFLRTVLPPAERVPYVKGLAAEFLACSGKAASASVLREGAQWAADIKDLSQRRSTLTILAHDLFLDDDYDGGRDALRRDPDVNWRTDTLIQLAKDAIPAPVQQMWNKSQVDVSYGASFAPQAPK
jgi:hypothetical protein